MGTHILILAVSLMASAQSTPPLTNEDVLRMVKAGLSEETIVQAIESRGSAFDTGPTALIALKQGGVGEGILRAMLAAGAARAETRAPSAVISPPDLGVFLYSARGRDEKQITELKPEMVTWLEGGRAKRLLLSRGHINGTVKGGRSKVIVAPPVEFVIRCAEGFSADEYQLVRFWEKKDRREFRALTGGVIHASLGAHQNHIPFEAEKVAPQTFRVRLEALKPGQYGFLPPGAVGSASAVTMGKVYTFAVE